MTRGLTAYPACHAEGMNRTFRVIFASGLSLVGLAGAVSFLTGQGLDRAEKWVSLTGVFLSVTIGVAGLVLGWRAYRQAAPAPSTGHQVVRRTGDARATGPGSRAVTGTAAAAPGSIVEDTGDATAHGGGHAITGLDRTEVTP
jgi:hypothetical protein